MTAERAKLTQQISRLLKTDSKHDRDNWTEAFQSLRRSGIRDDASVTSGERTDVLLFLARIPHKSKTDKSQVKELYQQLMERDPWKQTARTNWLYWSQHDMRLKTCSISDGCGFRDKWQQILIIGLLLMLIAGCCERSVRSTSLRLINRWFQDAGTAIIDAAGGVTAIFGIALVGAMLWKLCRCACRNLKVGAVAIYLLVNLLMIAAIMGCLSVFTDMHVRGINVKPWVMSGVTWFVLNIYGIISQSVKLLSFIRWRLITWGHCCLFEASSEYSDLILQKQVLQSAKFAKSVRKSSCYRFCSTICSRCCGKRNAANQNVKSEPLMKETGKCSSDAIVRWASVLQTVVKDESLGFDDRNYEALVRAIESEEKATIQDVFNFLFMFMPTVCSVACPAFKRILLLETAKSAINKEREALDGNINKRMQWQLLVDQYDWYIKNGYCMCDVMAMFVARTTFEDRVVRGAGVLRVLKALDDAFAFWLGLIGQKPLWIPTPEQRLRDLRTRLDIVDQLASGRYALSTPSLLNNVTQV